jgi:hypothetical protein
MPKTRKPRRLADAYTFAGFRPLASVQGIFGDPQARLITLVRRGKKRSAERAEQRIGAGTTVRAGEYEICRAGLTEFIWIWRCGAFTAAGVPR